MTTILLVDSASGAVVISPSRHRLSPGDRSSAGATDLGSLALGPGESFSAAGVPPGRYFVRLHTVNSTGESAASANLVIDVP